MNEDYISFETAKLLKEKGFNEYCYQVYHPIPNSRNVIRYHRISLVNNSSINEKEDCVCPTLQIVMKWLREKDWVICIIPLTFYCGEKASSWGYHIWAGDNLEIDEFNTPEFNTYEEACEAAIKYCLKNLNCEEIKEDSK